MWGFSFLENIMKKIIKLLYQKTVALIVALSLLVTILMPANSFAFTNVNLAVSPFIPSSLGKVTSSKFYDSRELIINIQDLHCHPQTQRNIASILEYLSSKYNIDRIYLEGAYKNINTKMLSDFKNEQFGSKILESLVDNGQLSGTEYYSAISGKNEIIAPMEEEGLYKENIKLFGEIINKRPDVEQICSKLENDINSIKKDYFEYNRELRKFERIITKFKNKKLTPANYYGLLENTALKNNIDLKNYPNIAAYINLLKINNHINRNKLPSEIKQFMASLKAEISYGEYINLLNESNNLKDITNISQKLLLFNETYKITEKFKLKNVNDFLQYIEFNKNINPIEFIDEEENLIDTVFSKLAKNKYEHEVLFLSYFLPKIKDYFLADITAKNYYKFDGLFTKFKKILLSYSSDEIVSELDKYQNLLSLYHKNNIKRDSVFAQKLIEEKNKNNVAVQNTSDALKYIEKDLQNKKIKLVVTGGFHTTGLENTLENNKISYVIITPKITSDIDKAKEIYTDTIKYNANILTNTINIEALCQSMEIAIPTILNDIFYIIKNDNAFKNFKEKDILNFLNSKVPDNVKILKLDYSSIEYEQIKYTVTYIENGKEKTIENVYSSSKDKDEKNVKKNRFTEAVILKDLFKSFGEKINLIYETIIAPIAENFVFLYIPFVTTVTVAPYLSALPFAVTAIFGVFVFPLAHLIADYFQKDDNKKDEDRIFKKLLVPGVLFSGVFIAFSLAFPGCSFVAFVASSVAHSIYNILVIKGIINLPLASIINKFFGKNNLTKEEVDNIIETDTFHYQTLKEKLQKTSDEEVIKYIIEKLYEKNFINNKEIPADLKNSFSKYDDVKMYFYTIYNYDISNGTDIEQLDKGPLQTTIKNLRKINFDNFYINEFETLKDNLNADTLPIIKFLLKDIIDETANSAEKKQYEKTKELLEAVKPVYKQVVEYYGTSDDHTIETIRNIVINNIKNDELVTTAFNFIFEVYELDKQKITYLKNGLHRPIIKLLIEILDNLDEQNINQQEYLEKLKDTESIKNIFKYYVFEQEKENKEVDELLFKGIIENCSEFTSEEIIKFCKKMPINILNIFIETMYDFVDNEQNNFEKRQIVAKFIGKAVSNLAYIDEIESGYINIDKLNQLYDNAVLEEELYLDNLYDFRDRGNVNPYFSFTPLLRYIYKENKEDINKCIIKRKLIYTEFTGKTNSNDSDVQEILKQLEDENTLRLYNDKALENLSSLSDFIRQGKTNEEIEEKFNDICENIERMIESFEMIDPEGKDSQDAINLRESLKKIRRDFDIEHIYHHFKAGNWEDNALSEITSLNSLINAVHQTSAKKFIANINLNFSNSANIQKISTQYGNVKIEGYNLSDKNINKEILDLFTVLLQGNDTSINNLIILNDELFWTCRLRVHSISIHFDFKNKQINLSFTESSNNTGNRARIRYFKKILEEELGFPKDNNKLFTDSASDVLTLRKNIDKSTGINDNTDFVDLAQKVIFLFRHSDELDVLLGNYYGFSRLSYRGNPDRETVEKELQEKLENKINGFIKVFSSGFMWFNYRSKSHEYFKAEAPVSLFLSNDERIRFEGLNAEIEKLNEELKLYNLEQLPLIPNEILKEGLITQKIIDEYINNPLEKAFAEGRIVFDKNTNRFMPNSKFNFSDGIINHIKTNENDSVKQAEFLNFIDNNKFNFNTVANIGGLVLKSGYIKLSGDKFLSVKVLAEPNGKNFKYAYTELVTLTETVNLKYDTLNKVLKDNRYNVPTQIEDISEFEKQSRKKLFDKEIVYFDTPSIIADGVSAGNGKYVYGKITLNKTNTDKNKILATSYTTPEDTDVILNSKAVITTTGSKISHSSIVTNEAGIPAVNISDGIWAEDNLYIEDVLGQKFVLKEGSKVLLNGETGHILILDDIDESLLDTLLYYVNIKDINGLVTFLNKNSNNKDLNKLIECAFFQLQNDEVTEILNSDIDNYVKDKFQNLINIKLKETEQQIEQTIINIKNTDNVIVKYMLVKETDKKIGNISNINNGLIDKYTVYRTQVLAGVNNFITTQLSVVNEMLNLVDDATDAQKTEFVIKLRRIETLIPYLQTKYENDNLEELKNKTDALKKNIINSIDKTNITTVKSSNEKSVIEDFIKYGAKFINTAITSRFIKKSKINNVKVPVAYGISEATLIAMLNDNAKIKYKQLNKKLDEEIKNGEENNAKKTSKEIVGLIKNNISNRNVLEKEIEQLDNEMVYAVRSSGIGEDEGQSFAGMGKTNLNVTKENIIDSVIDSWKSFYLETPVKYMANNKKRVQPCIMVQPFITGEVSGIVFSRNRNGYSDISAGYGLGEGIVSNTVPADEIEVNINNGQTINYNNVNKNLQMLPQKNKNGTEIKIIEDEIKAKSRALSDKEISSLMKIIKFLEDEYGYPVDVEWTIKDGIIYILQVRPITILNTNEDNIKIQEYESRESKNYDKAASILDNLFSNKTTNLYEYWTTVFAPAIETLLFIVIPFVLFATNPLIFWTISVVGFAVSHRIADEIINKFIDSSAEIRSLSDITKLAGAGFIFSVVFLATNILLPGYPIISFVVASVAHSIYNKISIENKNLPVASLINENHITYPIADEANFDIEEIYNKIGIKQLVNEIELWNKDIDDFGVSGMKFGFIGKLEKFIDRLYLDRKLEDAAAVIKVAYKLGLVTDVAKITNLAKAGYEGAKFFYSNTGVNDKNKNLENAVMQTISKFDEIDKNNPLYDDVLQIKEKLQKDLIDKEINETTILVVDDLFKFYPGKINNSIKKGRMTIEQAGVLFEAIVPLYQEMLNQNIKFNKKLFEGFKNFALLAHSFDGNFYSNKDSAFFKVANLLCELTKTDFTISNNNKYVVEIAKNIKSKEDSYAVLTKLKDVSPEYYISVSDTVFEDIGLNKITLNLLLESLKRTETKDYKLKLPLNSKENIDDIFIINEIVNYCENLDMGYLCHYVYFEFEQDKEQSKFTEAIISELVKILKNENEDSEKRKNTAVALGQIYSIMYEYIDIENIPSIDELNKFYKNNNMDVMLVKNGSYIQNFSNDGSRKLKDYTYRHVNSLHTINNKDDKISDSRLVDSGIAGSNFAYTNLILKQGSDVADIGKYKLKEHAPSFVTNISSNNGNKIAVKFDSLNKLLEYNLLAVGAIDDIISNDKDEDDKKGSLIPVINYLGKMIDCMEIINKEHADKSRIALERIKKDIYEKDYIDRQIKLNPNWNEDYLDEVDTLHTLINAVHQTSFKDLTDVIKQKENLKEAGLLEAKFKGTEITAYNFSNNEKINSEVKKLVQLLSLDKHNVELFVKDGTVIWTKRLLAHSVDIIMNFSGPDRGIKIYYNEGGATTSNKWRIDYFTEVLTELGFDVETNTDIDTRYIENYVINANLDNNSGLNNEINLPYVAATVMKLFEYSVNMDIHLEESLETNNNFDYDYGYYDNMPTTTSRQDKVQGYIEGYAELFNNGEIESNYDKTVGHLIYDKPTPNDDVPVTEEIEKIRDYLNDILKNLGLPEFINEDKFIKGKANKNLKVLDGKSYYLINGEKIKSTGWGNDLGQKGRNFFQKDIDTYFNEVMEKAFIKGQIILKNSNLTENKNYNENFEKMFEEQSEDILINNAEIIKMVPEHNITYYDTVSFFGSLIARDGVVKLLNGDYLYIMEFINQSGKAEYAQVEFVSVNSERTKLTGEKLTEILDYEGYDIKDINLNLNEKEKRKNKFKEKILYKPEQLIQANITSKGKEEFVIGEVSFDSDNIDGDKILFKRFTTPKDFTAIKNAGGVITTSGGTLSHAAVTTKELEKPSLIADNCQWKQDENGKYLEVINYRPVGQKEIKIINDIDVETQKSEKEIVKIRPGDKILMSAENGFIVKLSEDKNLEEQKEEIFEYADKLKQQKKSIQKKEWIEELNIIAQTASKTVAEILLFDVRRQVANTTLSFSTEDKKEMEDKMEETKNIIYDNIEGQYLDNYYQEQNDEEDDDDIDKFIKEKDIVNLDKIKANQKNMFGGKTVELAKMINELIPSQINATVPKGVGLSKNVPKEYYGKNYTDLNNKLQNLIDKDKKDTETEKEIENLRTEIIGIMEESENKEIENLILENIDENKYYAVRSSGIGEDGREYAFAGMGESVLNVKGSDVIKEIKNVWKSFYSKEAIEYMINSGQFIQPALLIQEMVDAACAGVAFSRNEKGNLIINVTEGLGDKVVDGTVTPNEIEVNPITGEAIESNFQNILTSEQIKLLNETVMFLEDKSGYPIDSEFAFDEKGKLNILQRRPDTKFNKNLKLVEAEIEFNKTTNNQAKLFCVEYNNKNVSVAVEFNKENKQITFVVSDNNFNIEDKNTIINKIKDRINTDIVVRGKVNGQLPIFNSIAPGQLEILPPVHVDNLEIDRNDIDDFKNSRNTINILSAA